MNKERIESIRARRTEITRIYNALADEKEMLEKRMEELNTEDGRLWTEIVALLGDDDE